MTRQYAKRYDKIFDQMELLGIKDVSTTRQAENGTRVWRLPIKYSTHPKFIEVASFATGYVRNQNGGYTNYQLNKRRESEPQYYPEYKWCDDKDCNVKTGKFHQYTTRACVLIPNEVDRLEYLIGYCLKNYYIKKANEVINGKYISKWEHEYELERNQNKMEKICHLDANAPDRIKDLKAKLTKVRRECNHAYDCGLSDGEKKANETYSENTGAMERIDELESQVDVANDKLVNSRDYTTDLKAKLHDLENKLATIQRIADHG